MTESPMTVREKLQFFTDIQKQMGINIIVVFHESKDGTVWALPAAKLSEDTNSMEFAPIGKSQNATDAVKKLKEPTNG